MMLLKPGKLYNDVKSYASMFLPPVFASVLVLRLKNLKLIKGSNILVPDYQYKFLHKPLTVDQVHRITNIIEKLFEEKQMCNIYNIQS